MIAEWFRDWKSPLTDAARELYVPYYDDLAPLKSAPEYHAPAGLIPADRKGKTAAPQPA